MERHTAIFLHGWCAGDSVQKAILFTQNKCDKHVNINPLSVKEYTCGSTQSVLDRELVRNDIGVILQLSLF